MSTVQSEIAKRFEIHVKEHSGQLLQHLNSARKERRLCDFLIKVGSEEIHAHRIILSEGCGYYKRLMAHKMTESESGVVEMKGVDPECMLICIEYIYTGKVSVLMSKLQPLLQVADMLQLPKLCEEIASLLKTNLDANSFFTTRIVANTFNLEGLKEHCDRYAMENFELIAMKEAFNDLEKEYVWFLLGAEDTTASEPFKCKTLVSWASSDPTNRSKIFEEVFQSFDFKKIPAGYKLHFSEKEPLVSESLKCVKKLFQTMLDVEHVTMQDYGEEVASHSAVTHDSHKAVSVIAVFGKKSKVIQAFKPSDKSWTRLHVVTDEIISRVFTAVALDDAIIVLAKDKTNYRLEYTDPEPKWIPLPDRSVTGDVVAVALHGEVYAFDDEFGQTIEKLDIHQTSWSQMTNPFQCIGEAVIAVGDFIYTFGGYDREVLSKAAKFDPSTSTWSDLPSMPTARQHAGVATLDDRIYVMGGLSNRGTLTTTESFDIQSQVWTKVKPMTEGRYLFNACTINGKIYAVGSRESENLIDEYDPDTDTWQTVGTMDDEHILLNATISISI